MGRKRKQSGPISLMQRIANRERIEKEADVSDLGDVVTPFARQHGKFEPAAKTGPLRKAVVNRGGTALDRWMAGGYLSETQLVAILHCKRLWRLAGQERRLVANLDRTVFGCPGDGNPAEIDARRDLGRIESYFPHPLDKWWNIFENVCRFDEEAGAAGSRIANVSRSAAEAARLTVCFVADTIYQRERLSY